MKRKKNTPSPCQSCSKEQWAECFRKGKACEKLLLWARNLKCKDGKAYSDD